MGQGSSKRRSYTPGKSKNNEVATPPQPDEVGVNGAVRKHRYNDRGDDAADGTDLAAAAQPDSDPAASLSTSSGKKAKRKRFRVGFSLKRTPSGRWSRKQKKAPVQNGAGPAVDSNLRPGVRSEAADTTQDLLAESHVSEEDEASTGVVETLKRDERRSKPKGGEKSASKSPDRSTGYRASGRRSGRKKKKNSKKDKKKKSTSSVGAEASRTKTDRLGAQAGAGVEVGEAEEAVTTKDKDVGEVESHGLDKDVEKVESHRLEKDVGEVESHGLDKDVGKVESHGLEKDVGEVESHRLEKDVGEVESHRFDKDIGNVESHSLEKDVEKVEIQCLDKDIGKWESQSLNKGIGNVESHSLEKDVEKVELQCLDKDIEKMESHSLDKDVEKMGSHVLGEDIEKMEPHSLDKDVEKMGSHFLGEDIEKMESHSLEKDVGKVESHSLDKDIEKMESHSLEKDTEKITSHNLHQRLEPDIEALAATIVAETVSVAQQRLRAENNRSSTCPAVDSSDQTGRTTSQDIINSEPENDNPEVLTIKNDEQLQKFEEPSTLVVAETPETQIESTNNTILEVKRLSFEASPLQTASSKSEQEPHSSVYESLVPNRHVQSSEFVERNGHLTVSPAISPFAGHLTVADSPENEDVPEVNQPETSTDSNSVILHNVGDSNFLEASGGASIGQALLSVGEEAQYELSTSERLKFGPWSQKETENSVTRTSGGYFQDGVPGTDHIKSGIVCEYPSQADPLYEEMGVNLSSKGKEGSSGGKKVEELVAGSGAGTVTRRKDYDEIEIKTVEPNPALDSEESTKNFLENEIQEQVALKAELLDKEKDNEKRKEEDDRKLAGQNINDKSKKEKSKSEKRKLMPKKLSNWFHKSNKLETSADNTVAEGHDTEDVEFDVNKDSGVDSFTVENPDKVEMVVDAEVHISGNSAVSSSDTPDRSNLTLDVNQTKSPPAEVSPDSNEASSASASVSPTSPTFISSGVTPPTSDNEKNTGFGFLKKISIGSRLRSAISRRKSSDTSDTSQEEKKTSLTQSKTEGIDNSAGPSTKLQPRKPVVLYSPVAEGAHKALFSGKDAQISRSDTDSSTQVSTVHDHLSDVKIIVSNNDIADINEHKADSQPGHGTSSSESVTGENTSSARSSVTYLIDVNRCDDEDDDMCPLLEVDEESSSLDLAERTNKNSDNIPSLQSPELASAEILLNSTNLQLSDQTSEALSPVTPTLPLSFITDQHNFHLTQKTSSGDLSLSDDKHDHQLSEQQSDSNATTGPADRCGLMHESDYEAVFLRENDDIHSSDNHHHHPPVKTLTENQTDVTYNPENQPRAWTIREYQIGVNTAPSAEDGVEESVGISDTKDTTKESPLHLLENGRKEYGVNGSSSLKSPTNDTYINVPYQNGEEEVSEDKRTLNLEDDKETSYRNTDKDTFTSHSSKEEFAMCHTSNSENGIDSHVFRKKVTDATDAAISSGISNSALILVDDAHVENGHRDDAFREKSNRTIDTIKIDPKDTTQTGLKNRSSSNHGLVKMDDYISSSSANDERKEESSISKSCSVHEGSRN